MNASGSNYLRSCGDRPPEVSTLLYYFVLACKPLNNGLQATPLCGAPEARRSADGNV